MSKKDTGKDDINKVTKKAVFPPTQPGGESTGDQPPKVRRPQSGKSL
jgi:hypothetical protein